MSMPDPATWRQMLAHLRRHHADICRQWFEELEPLELAGGVLRVRANTPVQQNYLTKRCTDAFNEAAQSVTGALIAVSFVDATGFEHVGAGVGESRPAGSKTSEHSQDAAAAYASGALSGAREIKLPPPGRYSGPSRPEPSSLKYLDTGDDQIVLSPDYVFDNFVTGPGNHLAYAAAVAVADNLGRAYNPLFVHGGVGLGKTHLLQAVCQAILAKQPDTHICYLSCDTFMNQFLEAVQNGQMSEFRTRYRHVDLLLIDDIHFLTNRERTQEEFFHTFNTLYQSNKQIVLSSDSPPNEIPQLEERLVSRFNWGLVARIDPPCYETRVAIVKTKARLRGFELGDDVVCYIAERIDTNIRELEGAITKVQSLTPLRGGIPNLTIAREALGDDGADSPGPKLTIQNIIDAVTHFYGVKLLDLQSKRRHRSITVPRQVCMYLARKRTRYSLEEIGGYFGGRDHTTVMHAIKTTEDRMSVEPDFSRQIEQLDRKLATPGGN